MKIAYKDFEKATKMLGFVSDSFQTAVDAANEWIATAGVKVINVETLCNTSGVGGSTSTYQDGVRVWYTE